MTVFISLLVVSLVLWTMLILFVLYQHVRLGGLIKSIEKLKERTGP